MPNLSTTAVMLAFATLSVVACSASGQATFIAAFLPATNLPGYVPATLADIRSDAFAEQYNSVGINFLQPYPGGTLCCLLSISEGFLVFGPNATYFNYLQAYLNDQDTCTTGQQPNNTTFAIASFIPGPFAGTWFAKLDAKERASLRTTPAPSPLTPPGYASCLGRPNASNVFTAIFKLANAPSTPAPTQAPQFMVQPTGPAYPAPPTNLYQEMYLSDVRSPAFQEYYNTMSGVLLMNSGSTNYCCLMQLADGGYLSYGPEGAFSPLSLVLPNSGQWQCGQGSNNQLHWLGTPFGGSDQVLLPTLNSTIVSQFGYFVNNTQNFDGCNGQSWSGNSLTLYMRIN